MHIPQTLKAYLDHEHIHYDLLPNLETFGATEISCRLQSSTNEMAKVVIVKADERFVMTVLPANWSIDLHRLKDIFLAQHVRVAAEDEIRVLFPDCVLGAMPPFSNLDRLLVYIDQSLTEEEQITFQADIHSDAIRMRYMDFAALVFPVVAEFHHSPSAVW
ncbi:MAG: YbaK/EbsC family protein [Nitrospiraceae bacterium]|nr:YbaK/EbsC family protein [Nitrospiraceae bacterium]